MIGGWISVSQVTWMKQSEPDSQDRAVSNIRTYVLQHYRHYIRMSITLPNSCCWCQVMPVPASFRPSTCTDSPSYYTKEPFSYDEDFSSAREAVHEKCPMLSSAARCKWGTLPNMALSGRHYGGRHMVCCLLISLRSCCTWRHINGKLQF